MLSDSIRHGWDEQRRDSDLSITVREVVHVDWFKLVYEHFSAEYKSGGDVTHALNRLLFYQVRDDIKDLPDRFLSQHFDELSGDLLGYFRRLENKQEEVLLRSASGHFTSSGRVSMQRTKLRSA
jgi:hypothetical protein